jgi:hypothetical protein
MMNLKAEPGRRKEEPTVWPGTTIAGPYHLDRGATTMTTDPKLSESNNGEPVALNISSGADGEDQWTNRRATEQAHRAATARQASGRRRFVDPTTCERDYSGEEMEFMRAMQDYKKSSGRMFPTWSEILEVLRALGYEKAESTMSLPGDAIEAACR